MRLRRSLPLLSVIAALGLCPQSQAQDKPEALPEYVIKAGFLLNFAKYIVWPEASFAGPESPYRIAVFGKDPFGDTLEKAFQGRKVRGRTLAVERFGEVSDIGPCHILFVPQSELLRLPDILKRLGDRATLTVGEGTGFCTGGGALNILVEKEKPKLEVNPEAVERAKLLLDPKLVRAATVVKTGKRP